MRRWAGILGLGSILLCAVAFGDATALLSGEKVTSTLPPGGAMQLFALSGVAGSALDVTVRATHGSQVAPELTVLRPDGEPADLTGVYRAAKGTARIRRLAIEFTGVWRVGVRSPSGTGGTFEFATRSRVPTRFAWTGALDGSPVEVTFDAAPGSTVALSAVAKEKPSFTPNLELISPSGNVVAQGTGAKARASLRSATLDELGRYTVRLSGGDGRFAAAARVRLAGRRKLVFDDVESRPEILSVSPTAPTNQARIAFALSGVGFLPTQTASLALGVKIVATGSLVLPRDPGATPETEPKATATTATAVLDLADVAPGTYSFQVASQRGNVAVSSTPIVVTNRVPAVAHVTPRDVVAVADYSLEVRGVGFDDAASLTLRRSADNAVLPVQVASRAGHEVVTLDGTRAPYTWGLCDLEVRDPDGSRAVLPAAVDFLGLRSAPVVVRSQSYPMSVSELYVSSAVTDDVDGRVLIGVSETPTRAVFVLVDRDTLATVDTLVLDSADIGGGTLEWPIAAYDRASSTFLVSVHSRSGFQYFRLVAAGDLHQTRMQTSLSIDGANIAADATNGGYLLVWAAPEGGGSAVSVTAQAVNAVGYIDPSRRRIVTNHPLGYVWSPNVCWQEPGRFIVAWAGADDTDSYYAVHATVVDSNGQPVPDAGPTLAATETWWTLADLPILTRNPDDGSALLCFSFGYSLYHPAAVPLAAHTAEAGPWIELDLGLADIAGEVLGVVWNPDRAEYAATYVTYDSRTAVRRLTRNGTMKAAASLETYEGAPGVLFSGGVSGALGLARTSDGVEDGVFDSNSFTKQALVAPLR